MRYDSYRTFLSDIFKSEKSSVGATLAKIAEQFDMTAPGLKMVIDGQRNLSVHKIYRIGRVLKFSPLETEFFEALVLRDQADDPDERAFHHSKLLLLRERSNVDRVRISDPVLFSNWWLPSLLLYIVEIAVTDPEKQLAPGELSRTFSLPEAELAKALDALKESGILATTNKGRFKIQADRVASTISQRRFMRSLLEECRRRVDVDYADSQSFFTADTLPLTTEQFKAFVMEYKALVERFMSLATDPAASPRIYQTSVQAFPVTR